MKSARLAPQNSMLEIQPIKMHYLSAKGELSPVDRKMTECGVLAHRTLYTKEEEETLIWYVCCSQNVVRNCTIVVETFCILHSLMLFYS